MKHLNHIRDRYLKESFNMRLGHLASDLARIEAFLNNSMNTRAVVDILVESKFFIEWTAPEAPSELKTVLSEIQSKLALWQRHLQQKKIDAREIEALKKFAKDWSDRLIEISVSPFQV